MQYRYHIIIIHNISDKKSGCSYVVHLPVNDDG